MVITHISYVTYHNHVTYLYKFLYSYTIDSCDFNDTKIKLNKVILIIL